MKKIVTIAVVIFAMLVAVSVVIDMALKTVLEKGTEMVTGLRLTMSEFNTGLLRGIIDIRGLKLYNPEGFTDPVMIDMPEIYVTYDLPAILKGTVHLKEVRINLAEFIVVKDKDGRLNLDSLRSTTAQKQGKTAQDKAGKPIKMQIDRLKLKIGKAIYKDYSAGGAPFIKEFNIGIDDTYTNIDNPNTLISLIVVKALRGTTIANLANFDVGSLSKSVSGSLASAKQAVAAAQATITSAVASSKVAVESAKATVTTASASAKGATETAKKTAESLGGVFMAFGGSKE